MYEGFDLTRYVPVMSVTCLAFTCFFALVVPLVAIYQIRKRFRASYQALLYGIADYLSLEYVLCNVVWLLLLLLPVFQAYPIAYIIVGVAVISALFELGRYYIIGILQKHNLSFASLLFFATGISAMNSFLRVLVQAFESFVIAITINDTGLEKLAEEAGENALEMLQSIEPMLDCEPFVYLISGVDVFVNLLFHIAITILLYAVFTKRLPSHFLPISIGIRFLFELPGYLYSYNLLISNAYVVEIISITIAIITAWLAYRTLKVEMPEELDSLKNAQTSKAFPKFNSNVKKGSIRSNANILSNKKDN